MMQSEIRPQRVSHAASIRRVALPSGAAVWTITFLLVVSARCADDTAKMAFFEARIRPVLIEKCYRCHSSRAEKLKGGLKLDSPGVIRKGGDSGPAVVPGSLAQSPLFQAIARTGEYSPMPPKEELSDPVVDDFRRWIEMGAPLPP